MSLNPYQLSQFMRCLEFAAHKHRRQFRKGAERTPYINHPIRVAGYLTEIPGLTDEEQLRLLMAALLHDTVEDTDTTAEELTAEFGQAVCALVMEVTDDKKLPWQERKRLQVSHASEVSRLGALLKIADKMANVYDIAHHPPYGWPLERKLNYLNWAERVVKGLPAADAELEARFWQTLAESRRLLHQQTVGAQQSVVSDAS